MPNPFKKLTRGFKKTQQGFLSRLPLFRKKVKLSEDLLENLEETLIEADLGVELTDSLIESLSTKRGQEIEDLTEEIKKELIALLPPGANGEEILHQPEVILMVGVNGTGKTTTIGKLAYYYRQQGKKVLIGAGDTFRAAAVEQLKVWSERAGVDFISNPEARDPAAVVYDTLQSAISHQYDLVLIDTAGRLHTRVNLMKELEKIKRVIKKLIPDAPHQTLLVLDATTGQNAIYQAEQFIQTAGVNGIVITKLDGTAKGGIIFSIHQRFKIPIKWVGIGEKIDDLAQFSPNEFVNALFTADL